MRKLWESIKRDFISMLLLILIGFGFGKVYTSASILADCQVLGMTRFGATAMGCRVDNTRQ